MSLPTSSPTSSLTWNVVATTGGDGIAVASLSNQNVVYLNDLPDITSQKAAASVSTIVGIQLTFAHGGGGAGYVVVGSGATTSAASLPVTIVTGASSNVVFIGSHTYSKGLAVVTTAPTAFATGAVHFGYSLAAFFGSKPANLPLPVDVAATLTLGADLSDGESVPLQITGPNVYKAYISHPNTRLNVSVNGTVGVIAPSFSYRTSANNAAYSPINLYLNAASYTAFNAEYDQDDHEPVVLASLSPPQIHYDVHFASSGSVRCVYGAPPATAARSSRYCRLIAEADADVTVNFCGDLLSIADSATLITRTLYVAVGAGGHLTIEDATVCPAISNEDSPCVVRTDNGANPLTLRPSVYLAANGSHGFVDYKTRTPSDAGSPTVCLGHTSPDWAGNAMGTVDPSSLVHNYVFDLVDGGVAYNLSSIYSGDQKARVAVYNRARRSTPRPPRSAA